MTAVFADTFYFPALLNPRDEAHSVAVAWTSWARKTNFPED